MEIFWLGQHFSRQRWDRHQLISIDSKPDRSNGIAADELIEWKERKGSVVQGNITKVNSLSSTLKSLKSRLWSSTGVTPLNNVNWSERWIGLTYRLPSNASKSCTNVGLYRMKWGKSFRNANDRAWKMDENQLSRWAERDSNLYWTFAPRHELWQRSSALAHTARTIQASSNSRLRTTVQKWSPAFAVTCH